MYQANLQLTRRGEHGLTLDTGIYISRIIPGSVAARESMIAVGDRVEAINDSNLNNIKSAQVHLFLKINIPLFLIDTSFFLCIENLHACNNTILSYRTLLKKFNNMSQRTNNLLHTTKS